MLSVCMLHLVVRAVHAAHVLWTRVVQRMRRPASRSARHGASLSARHADVMRRRESRAVLGLGAVALTPDELVEPARATTLLGAW